jgi:hypothetical protein
MNFRAPALRILGHWPTALPSFRAKYFSRKIRTNGKHNTVSMFALMG